MLKWADETKKRRSIAFSCTDVVGLEDSLHGDHIGAYQGRKYDNSSLCLDEIEFMWYEKPICITAGNDFRDTTLQKERLIANNFKLDSQSLFDKPNSDTLQRKRMTDSTCQQHDKKGSSIWRKIKQMRILPRRFQGHKSIESSGKYLAANSKSEDSPIPSMRSKRTITKPPGATTLSVEGYYRPNRLNVKDTTLRIASSSNRTKNTRINTNPSHHNSDFCDIRLASRDF